MKTIGVFDSGIGGISVAHAVNDAFPTFTIEYRSDSEHLPYGTKKPEHILQFVTPIIIELSQECDVIIIACNTVTTTLIDKLRALTTVPIIGIEPMVKPASSLTKSKIITVCATPATLASKRYAFLKTQYAQDIKVIEPDCSNWAGLIENNEMNESKIREDILPTIMNGSDVIVLGCTHYHWIEKEIKSIVGNKAAVLQPEQAIVERLRVIIDKL